MIHLDGSTSEVQCSGKWIYRKTIFWRVRRDIFCRNRALLFSNPYGCFRSHLRQFFVRGGTLQIAESLCFPAFGYKWIGQSMSGKNPSAWHTGDLSKIKRPQIFSRKLLLTGGECLSTACIHAWTTNYSESMTCELSFPSDPIVNWNEYEDKAAMTNWQIAKSCEVWHIIISKWINGRNPSQYVWITMGELCGYHVSSSVINLSHHFFIVLPFYTLPKTSRRLYSLILRWLVALRGIISR